jgi:hypothetical protein
LPGEKKDASVLLFWTPADSCWRYSSGTNSSKRKTVEEVRGSTPPETVDLDSGSDLNSTCRENVRTAITNPLNTGAHQGPIAFSVDFITSNVYPSTAVDKITEHVDECLLHNHLCAHDRLRVPPKWWEGLLHLLHLAGDIGLLLRPRGDRICEGAAELKRGAKWGIHARETTG